MLASTLVWKLGRQITFYYTIVYDQEISAARRNFLIYYGMKSLVKYLGVLIPTYATFWVKVL